MRACTSPNSLANLLQESPASVLQKTSPLTLLASRKWGSSALTSTPRQYGMDTWLLTCTGSQVVPLSVLEKISRGVMVNNVFGGPTVMARLWMSGSVTPLVTTSHVLPPSLLCRTPSTSRPAQMCWWSTGSTTRAVTLGMPTLGHSSAICTDSLSQCWPPSVERNSAAGLVPAKMMSGSTGSMARAQMGISFMGEFSRSQCSPLSSLRYTPLSAPQYMIRGSLGCTARARTALSL